MTQVPRLLGNGRRRSAAFVALTGIGQAVAAGVAAFATRAIFAALHDPMADLPIGPLLALFLAGLGVAGLVWLERVTAERLGQDYAIALRQRIFSHLTRMPASAVANKRQGALALRFVGDLSAARNWVGLGLSRLIVAAVVLPGAAIVLFLLNPIFAAVALVPLLVAAAAMGAVAAAVAPTHRRLRRRRANLAIDMMERVAAGPELRLLGRVQSELKRLKRRAGEVRDAAVRRVTYAAGLRAVPDVGTAAAGALVLLAAAVTGTPAAEAAAALAVLGILARPMRALASVWDRRCAWRIAREKIERLLSMPTLKRVSPTPQSDMGPVAVTFEKVSKGLLQSFYGTAAAGAKVAIYGRNGVGKSTCLALAAGLEEADSGRVLIGGADLQDVRGRTGTFYVGPHSPMLQGSLRRALTLGLKRRPDDTEVDAVGRSFGLGRLFDAAEGLDLRIAEGGRNLSSGEVRRVQLVRAALSEPRLLLLDEPESGLDAAGRAALWRLVKQTTATVLVATADVSQAPRFDLLWYLENGRLRHQGAVQDLRARLGTGTSVGWWANVA